MALRATWGALPITKAAPEKYYFIHQASRGINLLGYFDRLIYDFLILDFLSMTFSPWTSCPETAVLDF